MYFDNTEMLDDRGRKYIDMATPSEKKGSTDHIEKARTLVTEDLSLVSPFLDTCDSYIFIFDLNSRLLYASTKVLELTGYDDEITQRQFNDFFQLKQDYVNINSLFEKIIHKKELDTNGSLIHSDKSLIDVSLKLKYIPNELIDAILCLIYPKQDDCSETALRESQRQISTLMTNLQGMVYRCRNERNWPMEFVSDGCEDLLGYTANEITSSTFIYQNMIHPDDRDFIWEIVQKAVKKRERFQFVFRVRTATGILKWIMERGVGVYTADGELEALEGFITDVTQIKQLENKLYQENRQLRVEMNRSSFNLRNIIGQSSAMQKVYSQIVQAASSNAAVIIYGESGTGKELVAKAIHDMSERQDKKFVTINCGAIPDTLIESEFFGYKKGAFSGADRDKSGTLDTANNGTLFLDEIGEINKNMQVKLLRAIAGNGFTPIGGSQVKYPDVRIISATNRNLWDAVNKGRFRRDFFYRIHVIPIELPPLRERKEDISLLANHFLKKYGDGEEAMLPLNVMYRLQAHDWPGNVRELENLIHQYISTKSLQFFETLHDPVLNVGSNEGDLNFQPTNAELQSVKQSLKESMLSFEKKIISDALQRYNWHRGHVANELNIDYRTLTRKMKKHNLSSK